VVPRAGLDGYGKYYVQHIFGVNDIIFLYHRHHHYHHHHHNHTERRARFNSNLPLYLGGPGFKTLTMNLRL
jgi:hypothetical protein